MDEVIKELKEAFELGMMLKTVENNNLFLDLNGALNPISLEDRKLNFYKELGEE